MKTPFIVHCGECNHEWPAFYVPCNFTRVAELLKNAKCSICRVGAYNIFCGPAPVDEINTSSKRVKKKREKVNMSDDLVKRLRYLAKDIEAYESKTMSEAADRIEKLERALREIADASSRIGVSRLLSYYEIAKRALDKKMDEPDTRATLAGGKKDER